MKRQRQNYEREISLSLVQLNLLTQATVISLSFIQIPSTISLVSVNINTILNSYRKSSRRSKMSNLYKVYVTYDWECFYPNNIISVDIDPVKHFDNQHTLLQ